MINKHGTPVNYMLIVNPLGPGLTVFVDPTVRVSGPGLTPTTAVKTMAEAIRIVERSRE